MFSGGGGANPTTTMARTRTFLAKFVAAVGDKCDRGAAQANPKKKVPGECLWKRVRSSSERPVSKNVPLVWNEPWATQKFQMNARVCKLNSKMLGARPKNKGETSRSSN